MFGTAERFDGRSFRGKKIYLYYAYLCMEMFFRTQRQYSVILALGLP